MECRPILRSEADEFLKLLCEVFELDYARAKTVFFNEPLFDLQRKWALFDGETQVSILTTVPLQFGWGRAIGIAGVATRAGYQRKGMAARLLEEVMRESRGRGEQGALLFARDQRLYSRLGFQPLDSVVRGRIEGTSESPSPSILSFQQVREVYDRWAEGHPDRLRRDDRRWNYWKWTLRVCSAVDSGYLCLEGAMMRECVVPSGVTQWPVGNAMEWFGLSEMARELRLPLSEPQHELYLMGHGVPSRPQLFMTDQF